MKCPHCGGDIVAGPVRRDILNLADGTKTAGEIAKILGTSKISVQVAIHHLRKSGRSVDVLKERHPLWKHVWTPEMEDRLLVRKLQGEKMTDMGREFGITDVSIHKHIKESRIKEETVVREVSEQVGLAVLRLLLVVGEAGATLAAAAAIVLVVWVILG